MPGPYTIDASIFLNAFNQAEAGHSESLELLRRLQAKNYPIIVPTLLLPEVSAAIRRGRGDAALAQQFATALSRLPHLVLIPLDTSLAFLACEVSAQHRLRGADAVYAAVALRFASDLITLDREQHDLLAGLLVAHYPKELLEKV